MTITQRREGTLGRVSEILPGKLYVGGFLSPDAADRLVGLRIFNFARKPSGKSRRLVHFEIGDTREKPERMLEAALLVKREMDIGHRVLLHCWAGVNRSVTIAAVYLVIAGESGSIDAAVARIRAARPRANPKKALLAAAREAVRMWKKTSDTT